MKEPVIEIKNMSFGYNDKPILKDINFIVKERDFISIIGPNGGGKTTLLKLILGLYKPSQGSIRVLGKSVEKASKSIGYVPQDIHINQDFPITAIDVVLMGKLGLKNFGKFRKNDQNALNILSEMGLEKCAEKRINELSGGQRQRLFIARALITQPKILLLDEPTANIDTDGQKVFFRLLKKLNREITILMVSHDLMVVSSYTKSVACVNRDLHYHDELEISQEMMETMYPGASSGECPVDLLAHGMPHRVLKPHE